MKRKNRRNGGGNRERSLPGKRQERPGKEARLKDAQDGGPMRFSMNEKKRRQA
jgi:hypothetical protein